MGHGRAGVYDRAVICEHAKTAVSSCAVSSCAASSRAVSSCAVSSRAASSRAASYKAVRLYVGAYPSCAASLSHLRLRHR